MEKTQPLLLQHLQELKIRLLKCFLIYIGVFLILSIQSHTLYAWLAQPLIDVLPQSSQMIAVNVISPFFTPIKMAAYLSLYGCIPVFFYQAWQFIKPGLYSHEQQFVRALFIAGTGLFYLGIGFAYYIAFPLVFQFMVTITPDGATPMPDIHNYLSFVLRLFFAFGSLFQMPLIIIGCLRFGLVQIENLRKNRRIVVVIILVLGMILTPPDVISQLLIALPMYALFEIGLLIGSRMIKSSPNQPEKSSTLGQKSNSQH